MFIKLKFNPTLWSFKSMRIRIEINEKKNQIKN